MDWEKEKGLGKWKERGLGKGKGIGKTKGKLGKEREIEKRKGYWKIENII